jgi:hypothetical protein
MTITTAIREVGGIEKCKGGGVNMKGVRARKVADKNRYFHMNKNHLVVLAISLVISYFVGKNSGMWQFGVGFMVFLSTLILIHYLHWNSLLNRLLKIGASSEEELRKIISEPRAFDEAAQTGFEYIFDPIYAGLSINIFHKKNHDGD